MQTIFYVLASIAALLFIAAGVRMLVLMDRMEQTRKDLATLIAEGTLTLQHASRLLARMQDSVERIRHAVDRIEKVVSLVQPATAVSGMLAGARRIFGGGRREPSPVSEEPVKEANHG